MKYYVIHLRHAALEQTTGMYRGRTEGEALNHLARSQGHADYNAACAAAGLQREEVHADLATVPYVPRRVLVGEDGKSVAPMETDLALSAIFVRDDGWVLGAPAHLERTAYELWAGQWSVVYISDEQHSCAVTEDWYRRSRRAAA